MFVSFASGILLFMRHSLFLIFMLSVLPATLVQAAPAQQLFTDWQVTCNNQNFCIARNTGEHNGLVMTLSRSAGAKTDAVLRIDLGGLATIDPKAPAIAPRLLLDGEPLQLAPPHWQVTPWRLITDHAPPLLPC
ncbi:Protein of uncharacterised function (DUF1176) [Leclercia adecarboxylata]|uniref:Protein of uncharacterized function (DUF1176) n=1 Tax=Leclercia adecarboxylata TaxID=83655 RepID=A0A4U9IBB3_9ENTR|nr:Protein of uncharacterised function (DUF1176) [Leclercia adecarboxylata]